MAVNITVVKTGFIGVTTLIEVLLDERASRKDISVRSITSGSKMSITDTQEVEKLSSSLDTDLYIVVSPNASLDAPKNLALNLGKIKPTILISDSPASKIKDELVDKIGYIFVQGDPLIGIHKEFLDPIDPDTQKLVSSYKTSDESIEITPSDPTVILFIGVTELAGVVRNSNFPDLVFVL